MTSTHSPTYGSDNSQTRPRARNRWGEGDRLRDEILAAAGRLLGELGGVEGLTLRGVARAVGVAPSSIYTHFADKNELVAGLIEHEYKRMVAVLREADAPDPLSEVRAKLHAFCRYTIENPGMYRLLFGHPTHPNGESEAGGESLVGLISTALRACEQAGAQLRLPAERAAIVLIVGVHGRVAIPQARGENDLLPEVLDFADELLALVFADTDADFQNSPPRA